MLLDGEGLGAQCLRNGRLMVELVTEPLDPVLPDRVHYVHACRVDDGGVQCHQPLAGYQGGSGRGPGGALADSHPGPPLTGTYPLLKTSSVRDMRVAFRSMGQSAVNTTRNRALLSIIR